MKFSKNKFINMAIQCKVIQFGDFTLKSGRKSPYFFNAGLFYQGKSLWALGQAYASAYLEHDLKTSHLFGPAYKGISLASATAIALAEAGIDTMVTFNRKEAKTHGEQGTLIGAPLHGPVTIIDDVVTAGTAFREASQLIQAQGAHVHSLIVALDRCERGGDSVSAIDEIRASGVKVISLITLFDIIQYLEENHEPQQAKLLAAYQKQNSS